MNTTMKTVDSKDKQAVLMKTKSRQIENHIAERCFLLRVLGETGSNSEQLEVAIRCVDDSSKI